VFEEGFAKITVVRVKGASAEQGNMQ
jgi:hypothetical protein